MTYYHQQEANRKGREYEAVVRDELIRRGFTLICEGHVIENGIQIDLRMRPPDACADVWIECKVLHRNGDTSTNRAETMARACEIGYHLAARLPPSRRCDFWIISDVVPQNLALERLQAAMQANAVHRHEVIPYLVADVPLDHQLTLDGVK